MEQYSGRFLQKEFKSLSQNQLILKGYFVSVSFFQSPLLSSVEKISSLLVNLLSIPTFTFQKTTGLLHGRKVCKKCL